MGPDLVPRLQHSVIAASFGRIMIPKGSRTSVAVRYGGVCSIFLLLSVVTGNGFRVITRVDRSNGQVLRHRRVANGSSVSRHSFIVTSTSFYRLGISGGDNGPLAMGGTTFRCMQCPRSGTNSFCSSSRLLGGVCGINERALRVYHGAVRLSDPTRRRALKYSNSCFIRSLVRCCVRTSVELVHFSVVHVTSCLGVDNKCVFRADCDLV